MIRVAPPLWKRPRLPPPLCAYSVPPASLTGFPPSVYVYVSVSVYVYVYVYVYVRVYTSVCVCISARMIQNNK